MSSNPAPTSRAAGMATEDNEVPSNDPPARPAMHLGRHLKVQPCIRVPVFLSADARSAFPTLVAEKLRPSRRGRKETSRWLLTTVGTNVSVLGYFMNAETPDMRPTLPPSYPLKDEGGLAGRSAMRQLSRMVNDPSDERPRLRGIHGYLTHLLPERGAPIISWIDGCVDGVKDG